MSDQPIEADVVGMISPDTGAREQRIFFEDPETPIPVALYQAEKFNAHGVKAAETAILFRFHPTMAQRVKILEGQDLFLLMLLPNGRAPAPVELTIGAGPYQLERAADPDPIVKRLELWTPASEQLPEDFPRLE